MDFEDTTPFSSLAYDILDAHGDTSHVMVARGTYDICAAPAPPGAATLAVTHVARLAERQAGLVFSDAYYGEINKSSLKEESDLAQQKPRCDVIVIGSARSATGEPVTRIDVGIQIRREAPIPPLAEAGTLLEHRLVVHGARAFERCDGGFRLTDPEPFVELPLRYEHAFGGDLRVYATDAAAPRVDDAQRLSEEARRAHPEGAKAPIAHATCMHNPVGAGYLERWYADATGVERWPAPRIEAPGAPITAEIFARMVEGKARAGEVPELSPRGMGVVAKPWQPRIALSGTLDARWLAERWPLMPDDFDMAYWNGAHRDMQCDHLYGGEIVELWNLPTGGPDRQPKEAPPGGDPARSAFLVPEAGVLAHCTLEDGRTGFAPAVIDTLVIDLEAGRLSVVWRAVVSATWGVRAARLVSMGASVRESAV